MNRFLFACIVFQVNSSTAPAANAPLSVAVAGASGYAGGEVLRLLAGHPIMTPTTITALTNAGSRLGSHHQHLRPYADLELVSSDVENLVGHDVVVLALPHGASHEIAAELAERGDDALLLDCAADHRLESPADWEAFYGSEHPGTWTYGMPELIRAADPVTGADAEPQRAQLARSRRIAVPGCNVTAVTLALQPAAAAGLIDLEDLVAVLAVGPSGAGRAVKPHLLAAERLGSALGYGVGGTHRHIPEIRQNLAAATGGAGVITISFTPILVPMSRGILAVVTARIPGAIADSDIDDYAETLRRCYLEAYADELFVDVLPPGVQPESAAVLGANCALVQAEVDPAARRVVATLALDNLVKGTAGAAIQSANLALGLPEDMGLSRTGVAP